VISVSSNHRFWRVRMLVKSTFVISVRPFSHMHQRGVPLDGFPCNLILGTSIPNLVKIGQNFLGTLSKDIRPFVSSDINWSLKRSLDSGGHLWKSVKIPNLAKIGQNVWVLYPKTYALSFPVTLSRHKSAPFECNGGVLLEHPRRYKH